MHPQTTVVHKNSMAKTKVLPEVSGSDSSHYSGASSLSRLSFTPPTPPRKNPFGRPSVRTAPSKKDKQKQSKKIRSMKIRKLDDGRRVPMDWLPIPLIPFNYTLLDLEEAQAREDIAYRMFPRRKN